MENPEDRFSRDLAHMTTLKELRIDTEVTTVGGCLEAQASSHLVYHHCTLVGLKLYVSEMATYIFCLQMARRLSSEALHICPTYSTECVQNE